MTICYLFSLSLLELAFFAVAGQRLTRLKLFTSLNWYHCGFLTSLNWIRCVDSSVERRTLVCSWENKSTSHLTTYLCVKCLNIIWNVKYCKMEYDRAVYIWGTLSTNAWQTQLGSCDWINCIMKHFCMVVRINVFFLKLGTDGCNFVTKKHF